jgi:predicted acetyltransferase
MLALEKMPLPGRACDALVMVIEVFDATEGDRPVLRRLLELYRYDFSEFDGADVGPHGEFGYRYLDHYWTEESRRPLLFKVDGAWAGFALVRVGDPNDMAEFFILRKYRRGGVGRAAAVEVLRRFPGRWTVRQQLTNPNATTFWRAVIPYEITESRSEREVIMAMTVPE